VESTRIDYKEIKDSYNGPLYDPSPVLNEDQFENQISEEKFKTIEEPEDIEVKIDDDLVQNEGGKDNLTEEESEEDLSESYGGIDLQHIIHQDITLETLDYLFH